MSMVDADSFSARDSGSARRGIGRSVVSADTFRQSLEQTQHHAYDTGMDMSQMTVPDEEHEDITPAQREYRKKLRETMARNGNRRGF